jgi:hypothetical protein
VRANTRIWREIDPWYCYLFDLSIYSTGTTTTYTILLYVGCCYSDLVYVGRR